MSRRALLACGVLLVATAGLAAVALAPQDALAQETDDTTTTTSASEAASAEATESKPAKKSRNGEYEWKFAWGVGFEYGFFITELDRWDTNLLRPNGQPVIDSSFMGVHDLAIEIYPVEGLRLTAFGGVAAIYQDDPSLLAWYAGLEPAFTVRRDIYELSAGIGVGAGQMELENADGSEGTATHILVRPFLEPRIYPTDWMAIYLRIAFNLFSVLDFESDTLTLPSVAGDRISEDNLTEAGLYASIGFRFGSYPLPVAVIGDADGDGYLDDVDDCPQQAEDFDGFQDEDGCPDLDNDNDGIPDEIDQCPDTPEDLDGWKDEDGCPEDDDDRDGDGILDSVDQCPDQPEDFDGWKDEDGCPEDDDDRDGDGILDNVDQCPDEPGVPERQGCPEPARVLVTEQEIVITDKVFFELNKAVIKPESFGLLDEVADVIIKNPRIKLIEVGGHTDTAGNDKYNLKLSDQRAASVREYLIKKGVEPERLQSKGYGETRPLVPTPPKQKETPEAAAANRRVEFLILEQDEVKKLVPVDELPSE